MSHLLSRYLIEVTANYEKPSVISGERLITSSRYPLVSLGDLHYIPKIEKGARFSHIKEAAGVLA